MSILLRPVAPPRRIGGLSLVAGVAVKEALESLGARPISLYWPNDLYFEGRKLGGILGELRQGGAPDPRSILALGIGVNIDLAGVESPPELAGAIASLSETGCPERDPGVLAGRILDRLAPLYRQIETGSPIPPLVMPALAGLQRLAAVRIAPAPPFRGIVRGIGDEGQLLVEREGGGIEEIRAAEVDYEPRG
jgi:BirA family transcriptional regulator, biotin operon repressor / biotin---[acetyl-CoA-carboxylase] ligase